MYRDLNDYELLYMVCENDENDFKILLEKYKPLINKIIKDYVNTFKKFGYEIDDLMQIGYITLYKTSNLYNNLNQSMFYTYFKNALIKNISSVIRRNNTRKRRVLNESLSYYNTVNNSNIRFIDIIACDNKKYDYGKELIIFKNSMPITLSWIFELFYNGYSKEEISILLAEDIEIIKRDFLKIKEHALTYKYLFFS